MRSPGGIEHGDLARLFSGTPLDVFTSNSSRADQEGLKDSDLSPLAAVDAWKHPVRDEHRGLGAGEFQVLTTKQHHKGAR